MDLDNFQLIKQKETLIETNRLSIKKLKNFKRKMLDKMEFISNIYEYLVTPACAISIALVALFHGPIIYLLPSITAICAICVISYKFFIRNKFDNLDKQISILKEERQSAYDNREKLYENIFNDLNQKNEDIKDYYHQLLQVSDDCNVITKLMVPYKREKEKCVRIKNVISKVFDYILAPLAAVAIPLLFSFINAKTIVEVLVMAVMSFVLLIFALTDEKLTKRIEELEDEISELKSDRTVRYVKRDLKLKEALEFLKEYDENKEKCLC